MQMTQAGFVGKNRTSLNYILRKYVQEYKDELKLMDEDYEEDDHEEDEEESILQKSAPLSYT